MSILFTKFVYYACWTLQGTSFCRVYCGFYNNTQLEGGIGQKTFKSPLHEPINVIAQFMRGKCFIKMFSTVLISMLLTCDAMFCWFWLNSKQNENSWQETKSCASATGELLGRNATSGKQIESILAI